MIGAKCFFVNCQRTAVERLGCGVVTYRLQNSCMSIEIKSILIFDCCGFSVVAFGFGVVDLEFVVLCFQIVEFGDILYQS